MIAAVDPSLDNTAICGGDAGSYWLKCHHARAAAGDLYPRMSRFHDHADAITLTVAAARPQMIVLEGYSHHSRGNAVLSIAEFGAILRTKLLLIPGAKVYEVAPSTLKQFVCNDGNANKVKMVAALTHRYSVQFGSDDEYDAYGLYRLGLVMASVVEPATTFQRTAAQVALHGKPHKRKKKKKQ